MTQQKYQVVQSYALDGSYKYCMMDDPGLKHGRSQNRRDLL